MSFSLPARRRERPGSRRLSRSLRLATDSSIANQGGCIFKYDVGGVFGVRSTPIILQRQWPANLPMQRMGVRQDFGQFQGPMGSQLLIQQSLRLAEIGDAQKRVVFLLVSDAGLVQLTGQPVAAVKAEV